MENNYLFECEETESIPSTTFDNISDVIDTTCNPMLGIRKEWSNIIPDTYSGRASAIDPGDRSSEFIRLEGRNNSNSSIFNPAVAHLVYDTWCPPSGKILDPFAGGIERGFVAGKLGYHYTGIEIRSEQVGMNESVKTDYKVNPIWITGDSAQVIPTLKDEYDLVFTCPPYWDMEVYSSLPGDISTKDWKTFSGMYDSIISESVNKLKDGGYLAIVVGNIRKCKILYDLKNLTSNIAYRNGLSLVTDAVIKTPFGHLGFRTNEVRKNKKYLWKQHQDLLVYIK